MENIHSQAVSCRLHDILSEHVLLTRARPCQRPQTQTYKGRQSLLPPGARLRCRSGSPLVQLWILTVCVENVHRSFHHTLVLPHLQPTSLIQPHRSCLLLQGHIVTLSLCPTLYSKHAKSLRCCGRREPRHPDPRPLAVCLCLVSSSPLSQSGPSLEPCWMLQ